MAGDKIPSIRPTGLEGYALIALRIMGRFGEDHYSVERLKTRKGSQEKAVQEESLIIVIVGPFLLFCKVVAAF